MMVEFSGMSDKESQQRRGRADGAVWSVADRCSGANLFWTGVLLPPKKGRWSRKNQAGQGHEVDGGGRRPGSSFGKAPLFCIPARSAARGNDARDDPRKPPNPRRAAAAEAAAPDC